VVGNSRTHTIHSTDTALYDVAGRVRGDADRGARKLQKMAYRAVNTSHNTHTLACRILGHFYEVTIYFLAAENIMNLHQDKAALR
jgi:hypothetical protein